jgi:hypothetical protein
VNPADSFRAPSRRLPVCDTPLTNLVRTADNRRDSLKFPSTDFESAAVRVRHRRCQGGQHSSTDPRSIQIP